MNSVERREDYKILKIMKYIVLNYFTGTDNKSFDVTLDGIEIGYGQIEPIPRSKSAISEEFYDFPPQGRDSLISYSSTSSSVSSRSSNAATFSQPPPPCRTQAKYINISENPVNSTPLASASSDVSFDLASETPSPSQTDSCYVPPDTWTSPMQQSPSVVSSSETPSKNNSLVLSSKLDQIQRLLEDVTDPVSILCQSLHAENDRELDERMTSLLKPTEVLKHMSPTLDSLTGTFLCKSKTFKRKCHNHEAQPTRHTKIRRNEAQIMTKQSLILYHRRTNK